MRKFLKIIIVICFYISIKEGNGQCATGPSPLSVLNAGGNSSTNDHNKVLIGYITQWDAWKSLSGIAAAGDYTQLNVDFDKYTHLNYSFFGLADDGSVISPDLAANRNNGGWPSIVTNPNFFQSPGAFFNVYYTDSWDLLILWGALISTYYIGPGSIFEQRGYVNDGAGWKYTGNDPKLYLVNGFSGQFPLCIPDPSITEKTGLLDIAHAKGKKVNASIGGWSLSKSFPRVAADPAKRRRLASTCKKLIAIGFDGIDLDWEYPGQLGLNCPWTNEDYNNLLLLGQAIRDSIGFGPELSTCITNNVNFLNGFDFPKLSMYFNYFNVFGYDYGGGWSSLANHNGPLFDYPGSEASFLNIDTVAKRMVELGCPKNQITLGAGFYGRAVVCSGPADIGVPTVKQTINVYPDGDIPSAADITNFGFWDGVPNYSAIEPLINSGWTYHFDDNAKVPYLTKGNYLVSYDDTLSVAWKAKYISDNGYAGTLIWTVYGDLEGLTEVPSIPVGSLNKLKKCPNVRSPLADKMNNVFAAAKPGGAYTITTSANNGGSVTPTLNNISCGTNSIINYLAKSGVEIDSIIIDGKDSTSKYKSLTAYIFYNIQANHSFRIIFKQNKIRVQSIINNAAAGNCTPLDTMVDYGVTIRISISINQNYYLDSISRNGIIIQSNLINNNKTTATISNINQATTIRVYFGSINPPNPPWLDTCIAGNNSAVVILKPPSFDGGSAVNLYEVTTLDSMFSTTKTSLSNFNILGLTNGQTYRFRGRARNVVGWSNWDTFKYSIVPNKNNLTISTIADLANTNISPTKSYSINSNVTITYSPNEGYKIDSVFIDGLDSTAKYKNLNQIIFNNITIDHIVRVKSKIITYRVRASSIGDGGYISPTDTTVEYNSSIAIRIGIYTRFGVDSIFINNKYFPTDISELVTIYPLSIDTIKRDYTISVKFKALLPPNAPMIDSVVPGNNIALIYFSPPLAIGGGEIKSYEVSSIPSLPNNVVGQRSPIFVYGFQKGVRYNLRMRAYNKYGFSPFSDTSMGLYFDKSRFAIVTSSDNNATITPITFVDSNDDFTVTYKANSDFYIDSVIIDGINHPELLNNTSYIFRNVATDHTIRISTRLSNPYFPKIYVTYTGFPCPLYYNTTNATITVKSDIKPSNNPLIKAINLELISPDNFQYSNQITEDTIYTYRYLRLPGTYKLRAFINNLNFANFFNEFTINIPAPKPISAYFSEIENNKSILYLDGANEYYKIDLNGTEFTTKQSQFSLNLKQGFNYVVIKTDKPCQDSIVKTLFVSENVILYPNPVNDILNVYCAGNDDYINAEISNEKGVLIEAKKYTINNSARTFKISTNQLSSGVYLLKLNSSSIKGTYKFIKY